MLLVTLPLSLAYWAASHYGAWGFLWGCYLVGAAPEPPPPISFWGLWAPS